MSETHEQQGWVDITFDMSVPMRDGARLLATQYVPSALREPRPAILMLTPYGASTHHDRAYTFAKHGYPFLVVNVRGRGGSQGAFKPSTTEASDGYDAVEWLANQSYCNGKVAMCGGSYMGYAQWAVASAGPPSLRTIVPVASPFRGVDSPMRNNVFPTHALRWLASVCGSTSNERIVADESYWRSQFLRWLKIGAPFNTLDERLGRPSAIFQEWLRHPERGAYWDAFNPSADAYGKITVPTLTITGIYDGDQLGALAHYRHHLSRAPQAQDNHFLIIGPWDHAGTRKPQAKFAGLSVGAASLVDLEALHREWFAWTMEGGDKPNFLKRNVAYYVMEADRWCYADSLEDITDETQEIFLSSSSNPTDVFHSGWLAHEAPIANSPDEYVYDPLDISDLDLELEINPEDVCDQKMVHARAGKQLVYHTAPIEDEHEISGFFRLRAWLAIDQPDTDFLAAIYEVAPNGIVTRLSSDFLRARYRESLCESNLVTTSDPLCYEFANFPFVARRISAGSRLRLVLGPLHSIHHQKNYNSDKPVAEQSRADARPVRVRLFHDAEHPSALYVPIGRPQ